MSAKQGKCKLSLMVKKQICLQNVSKFMALKSNIVRLPNEEYLRDYRCEGKDIANKCEIFCGCHLTLGWVLVFCIDTHV